MKKLLTQTYLKRLALCGCFATIASSCVNDAYDLDNGISSEANVLQGVTIPLGSLPIHLTDMIDPESVDMLDTLSNGNYVISTSDKMSVDIDELSDDLAITIAKISEKSDFDASVGDVDIPTVEIDVEDEIDVDTGLSEIIIDVTEMIEANGTITPTYTNGITNAISNGEGTEIGLSQELAISDPGIDKELNIEMDIDCPASVTKIYDIEFGDGVDGVDLNITLDITALQKVCSAIEWKTPSITFTFSDEFKLDNGTNTVTFPSETVINEGVKTFTTQIVSYNKALNNTLDITSNRSKLDDITGSIECTVSGNVVINSATIGSNFSEFDTNAPFTLEVLSDALKINDLGLSIEDASVDISEISVSELIDITGISENIYSIEYVQFDSENSANKLEISIDNFFVPEGLSVAEPKDIVINFPADRFVMSDVNGNPMTPNNGNYEVIFSTDDIVKTSEKDAVTEKQSILLTAIEFYGDTGVVDEDGAICFDPNITVTGTTISLDGDLQLIAYNVFAKNNNLQNVDFSAKTNQMNVETAEFITNAISIEMDSETTYLTINEDIPTELAALYKLEFANDVTATIEIEIEGLPTGSDAGELTFAGFTIEFPDFIVFEDGQGITTDNELVLNGVEIGPVTASTRTFTKVLNIESFDFSDQEKYGEIITKVDDGTQKIKLNAEVKSYGDLKLAGGSADSDLGDIPGLVNFTLSEIEVGIVTGLLDVEMPEVSEAVDLSDMSEEMPFEFETISLTNPMIMLNIENSLPLELEISSLSIIPYKDGAAKDALSTKEGVAIAVAAAAIDAEDGEYTTTNIILQAKASTEAGYYQVEGLSDLLNGMPDSLCIEVLSEIVGDEHTIDLSRTYDLNLDYEVSVPLEFDDLVINYTDTLDGLQSTLDGLIEYLSTMDLQLEISSTLPFSVEITEIIAMDEMDNVLDLPSMLSDDSNKVSGSPDGSEVQSNLNIYVADNDAGDLKYIDKLLLTIYASVESETTNALNSSQYLTVGIKLSLPDGLSIDLDDLLGDDDDEE